MVGGLSFQSTRPVRGGTRVPGTGDPVPDISIHPPRAGRDFTRTKGSAPSMNFNPPAPCGAGPAQQKGPPGPHDFNPPAPCGAGLEDGTIPEVSVVFQSTRPVRGGTYDNVRLPILMRISIHPPRAGRDLHPCWIQVPSRISIHPPRAGRDDNHPQDSRITVHFNPPAPCGAGHQRNPHSKNGKRFQSTRPVRGGTTWTTAQRPHSWKFQSTRPVRGGTSGPDRPKA